MVTVGAFFLLLWIAVFLLDIPPDRAFVLALVTMALVGTGLLFTMSSIRRERDEQ